MYSIYSQKNYVNPNFGFNKLSVANPFNFYGLENTKNIYGKPNYGTFTHNTQRGKIYYDFILEENKQGVKTNPKQPPMTNTYDLNTVNVRTEQKYNPYFASNNYPQWMDKVKDLMNYGYNEEKATIYYTTDKPYNNENDYYGQTNISKETKKYNTMSHAPLSSRVPKIEKNIYSTFTNKNYHYVENNKNNLNPNYNYDINNNSNFTNGVNYVDNTTIIDNSQKSNNINDNLSNNYYQNIITSQQVNKQINLNQGNLTKEIISDNNSNEYYKESKGGLVSSYAYSEEPNLTHREYMEDTGIAIENFNNDPNKILFGLFDGHGGEQVSKFLQKNFALYMKQMLPFTNHFENFVNLFKILDDKVRDINCPDVGSTATIVYIERQNNKKYLYCVNVGDSRCIIVNKKGIMRLSTDDRMDDPKEKQRIINGGGLIYNGRIGGILMLSRSFGDWGIKKFGVSCEPHIAKIEINEDDLCLIIASDGVWDFMKEDDFKVLMNKKLNALDVCKDITIQSIRNGSSDNISCFVINF